MWTCKQCSEEVEEQFDVCGNCSNARRADGEDSAHLLGKPATTDIAALLSGTAGQLAPAAEPTDTAVCSRCGTTATPQSNVAMGLLKAIGAVLIVPVIMVILGAIWGPDVLHENSMLLAIFFLGTIAGAVSLLKGAWIGACPGCGMKPMVLLATPEGQHIVQHVKFRHCPTCQKPFKLDTSILKTMAKDQAVASLPCPLCRAALSVDMTSFQIMAP